MNQWCRRPGIPQAVAFVFTVLIVAGASVAWAGGDRAAKRDKLAFMDSRHSPANQKVLNARAAKLSTEAPAATAALKDSLGPEGVVKLDPVTGTASFIGKTDGFLTASSAAPAAEIGLAYVRAKAPGLGLTADGVAALRLARDYVDVIGTHHVSFVQQVNGISVFGNGVKVNVARDGRIINVTGSPVSSLAGAPAATPGINGTQAIVAARREVGFAPSRVPETSDADGIALKTGDQAKLVYFKTLDGLRLAWQTIVAEGDMYQSVVDATSGQVLWRQTLTRVANGKVWDNRPGAPHGGTQHDVDLLQWGPNLSPTTLFNNNSLTYSDVNASNNRQSSSESVLPGAYTFQPFSSTLNSPCLSTFPCAWDSDYFTGQFSWQLNRNQNGVQAFFFVNNFHDHLLASPIGFTEAAGNFQLSNATGEGFSGDPVITETDDGANTLIVNGTLAGLPDGNHSDNANMGTPPDGFAPRMQMFLFNDPTTMIFHNYIDPSVSADPFIQANGGDDASVVYHEYTHGLSNRLVVDADGNSTLGNIQAGSMGEAWSDWYALDYLEKTGNVVDAPGVADVLEGEYVSGGANLIRTEAIDCKVGTSNSDPGCPGDPSGTAGTGGYTYGDFGKIIGRPEVHADGEIWGQTLWDLRDAVGSDTAEMLVTRAMELSPGNPSFLDMRNSILAADVAAFGGANHATIWAVFAHRGMGYFAAAADGDDTRPVEDFQLPPTSSTFGKLLGKVTTDGGQPIDGAVVAFGGHSSGFADDIIGVTKQNGLYDIKKILVGSYPKVRVSAPGFDAVTQEFVVVDHHANHLDVALRRNWASLFGGGSIVSFNGPDYTPFGCGPTSAIDDSLGSGWGSDTDAGASTGLVQPKFIVVKLPGAVDVTEVKVDPANTCGDPGSSATRGYKLEASADGVTFTEVSKGVFYAANRNQLNTVALSGPLSGVQYLRFWMLNPQVPNLASGACTSAATCGSDPDDQSNVDAQCGPGKGNGFGGCTFMDMVELKVYGRLP